MSSCDPRCRMTSSLDVTGRRLMLSVGGNRRFPADHTLHPQCQDCIEAEVLEVKAASGDPDAYLEVNRKWLLQFKK